MSAARWVVRRGVLALLVCSCAVWAAEPDSGQEELRKAVAACAAAPLQATYEITSRAGKPLSEPATAEEEMRVKAVLQESKLPYDRVEHRATYDATLSMVRSVTVLRFHIEPQNDAAAVTQARQCLGQLAKDVGVAAEFGAPARKAATRKSK